MKNVTEDQLEAMLPLDVKQNDLANKIVEEDNIENVKDLVYMFNLNQAKRNLLRVMKLNGLLDNVSDQMIERMQKKPGEFSNNDLLNYMNVVQSAIDRANKSLATIDDAPAILINQQNNVINVNDDDTLNRESRQKIANAIQSIMSKMNLDKVDSDEDKPVEIIEEDSDTIDCTEIQDNNETLEDNHDTTNLLNEE